MLGLTVPPTLLAIAEEMIEYLISQSSSTAAMHTPLPKWVKSARFTMSVLCRLYVASLPN